jgi:hypothetical protein
LYNFQFVVPLLVFFTILNAAISPGSTVGASTPANSLGLIAEAINRAHKATENVVCVLENTVCFLVSFHVFPSHV